MAQADKFVSDGVRVWDVVYDTDTGAELYRSDAGGVAQWAGNPNVGADANSAAYNLQTFDTAHGDGSAPPTSAQIIAQTYVAQGYNPPPPDVIDDIISGAVDAVDVPVAPLVNAAAPPAPSDPPVATVVQNVVASVSSAAQTPAQSTNAMTGVYDNTPAFTVGNDASGNPIMQLVDEAGTLVQWTQHPSGAGFVVAPFDVVNPPAVNETRLIGQDQNGNPVFQEIDNAGNLLQWTQHPSGAGFVVPPFYVQVGGATRITPSQTGYVPGGTQSQNTGTAAGTVSGPANNIANGTTQSLQQPTIQVGTTASGQGIFQLVDAIGVVKQWIASGQANIDLVNANTYGVLFHTAATDAPATNPGTGIVSGGGGQSTQGGGQPGSAMSDLLTVGADGLIRDANGNVTGVYTPPTATPAPSGSGKLLAIAAVVGLGIFLMRNKSRA